MKHILRCRHSGHAFRTSLGVIRLSFAGHIAAVGSAVQRKQSRKVG